jgi:hypothetical protein
MSNEDQTPQTEAGPYGYDNPAPGTRLWRLRTYPETITRDDAIRVAHDLDTQLAQARTEATDACIYIVQQSRDTAQYEKDYASVIAREHVIRLLTAYREGPR